MEEKESGKSPNFWLALGLIIVGFLFLLDNFHIIDLGDLWQLWPFILIAIGIIKLRRTNYQDKSPAILLITIGGIFLLLNYDILDWDTIWQFWPLILILIGVSLIYKIYSQKTASEGKNKVNTLNRIDVAVVFGGQDKTINSEKFEGGNVSALFGGVKLNFNRSKLAEGDNILDVFTMFGGTEIYVPDDWNVIIKGVPIFGGFEDSRSKTPGEEVSKERRLIVKGFVMFGGLEIKSA